MPRTEITIESPVGPYPALPVSAGAAAFTMTAADTVNKNSAAFGGAARLLLVVQNTNAQTVTITSKADALGRTGDIAAYSVPAGALASFIFERNGWRQDDGALWFEGSHADVKFAVLQV
jgi:hypothetical protein